jgi:hypothetical protein
MQKKNPAEIIHTLAKKRGFAPKTVDPAAAAAATAAADAGKMKTVGKGIEENRSLSQARGSAPVPLTARSLLDMDEAEFARMIETPAGRALLG